MAHGVNMAELYRRRVRIESGPHEMQGWQVKITDADTGEEITHVARAVVTLDAREANVAELTYFEHDENGKIMRKDGLPIIKTVTVGSPELSVSAWERFDPPFYTHRRESEAIRFPQLPASPGAPS